MTPPPDWLQNNNVAGLQQLQARLPSFFDTRPMAASYANLQASNLAQGTALAAAGARAYQNRAVQAGGSSLGAGFAQGQAMLPIYAQNASLQSDLSAKQQQARQAYGSLSAQLGGDIARQMAMRQSMLSDFYTNQQKLTQDQSQFRTSMGEKSREFDASSANDAKNTQLQALQLAMKMPRQGYSYNTDNFGNPISGMDAQNKRASDTESKYWNDLRGSFRSFF